MLFNSLEFAVFLPTVFGLYWWAVARAPKLANPLLLVASYVFYGWWDWRFLSLIVFSSVVDYGVGVGLGRAEQPHRRKHLLLVSMLVNLGLLGVFKYYNFFAESLATAFTFFGTRLDPDRLDLVLPVGISFYTFQTMSYSIDVYRRKLEPSHDPVAFFTYVSFFPQLVAGPIERATNLLPQFAVPRRFDPDASVDGLRQILWGLFKKVVIADNCAGIVNATFGDPSAHSASTLALGAVLFAFQIYGDFSGYSDIAIGTARLFGFDLMQNFAFPYFSRDIAEFWRRWHMSLNTWFRDYLYIPLGGSRGTTLQKIRNTSAIFLISGFWHGANWTFIVWGLLHALFFLPLQLGGKNRLHLGGISTRLPGPGEMLRMARTFLLVDFAWIFFRADDVQAAFAYIGHLASPSLLSVPALVSGKLVVLIAFMLAVEWVNRHEAHGLALGERSIPTPARWAGYLGLTYAVLYLGGTSETFIYFQF